MQVNIESLSSLERRMTVSVPADQVEQEVAMRLKKQAQTANIKGFRRGKVPLNMIKMHYGDAIRQDVVSHLIQTSFHQALDDNKLNIVGRPQIKPTQLEADKALEYEATFEVYPQIEVKGIANAKIEKLTAEVTEADLEKVLEKMRAQHVEWVDVTRKAQLEDRLMIDIVGTVDGVAFQGGTANNIAVVLGSKTMIPGFEDGLLGAKEGEKLELDLVFPEQYPQKDLATKPVHFAITVNKVMEPKLPELNDAFAQTLDVSNLADLRAEVRRSMERELERNSKEQVKKLVLDELRKRNSIDIPQTLVDAEIERMQQELQWRFQRQTGSQQPLNFPKEHFAEQAKDRVLIGLLLSEFVQKQQVKVDQERVHVIIDEIASGYEQPEQIVNQYYQNKQLLQQVESLVLEEQAIDKLLEEAEVIEKKVNYEDIVKQPN